MTTVGKIRYALAIVSIALGIAAIYSMVATPQSDWSRVFAPFGLLCLVANIVLRRWNE